MRWPVKTMFIFLHRAGQMRVPRVRLDAILPAIFSFSSLCVSLIPRFLISLFQAHMMLWQVFFLICGIIIGDQLMLIEGQWLGWSAGLLILAGVAVHRLLAGRLVLIWLVCRFILSFLAGILANHVEIARQDIAVLSKPVSAQLTAEIIDIQPREENLRLRLRVLASDNREVAGLDQLRLTIRDVDRRLAIGRHIEITARLFPFQPPFFHDRPDYGKRQWLSGISATGYITALGFPANTADRPLPNRPQSAGERLKSGLDQIRRSYAGRLAEEMDRPEAAVAAALLVGRKEGLSEAHYDDFRRSGLAHLLAISGLHMGFFCFGVYGVLGLLSCLWRWPEAHFALHKPAAMLAILAGLFYLGLAGMPISATRAWLMASLVMVAVLTDRRAITLRSLALVAGGVLSIYPSLLMTAGFQLSFMASFAIIAGLNSLRRSMILVKWPRFFSGGVHGDDDLVFSGYRHHALHCLSFWAYHLSRDHCQCDRGALNRAGDYATWRLKPWFGPIWSRYYPPACAGGCDIFAQ